MADKVRPIESLNAPRLTGSGLSPTSLLSLSVSTPSTPSLSPLPSSISTSPLTRPPVVRPQASPPTSVRPEVAPLSATSAVMAPSIPRFSPSTPMAIRPTRIVSPALSAPSPIPTGSMESASQVSQAIEKLFQSMTRSTVRTPDKPVQFDDTRLPPDTRRIL